MSSSDTRRHDRHSDTPLTTDVHDDTSLWDNMVRKLPVPPEWQSVTAYLLAGIFLGLMLVGAVGIGRTVASARSKPTTATAATNQADTVTDNVIRMRANELDAACWEGVDMSARVRLTVALEVGVDGAIRYAAATGASLRMRQCVENHVRSWSFLPQRQAVTMALPVEVERP